MTGHTASRDHRFRSAISRLDGAQKPGAGVPAYTRWVNRKAGRYLASAAYSWGLTPNIVTAMSAFASLAGLVLLVWLQPSPLLGIGVAGLLALGYALDSADGQVARLTGTGSKRGEWLDHVVDAVRTPTIHVTVFLALWRSDDDRVWVMIIALAYSVVATGQFMSQILAEQLAPERATPADHGSSMRSLLLTPVDMGILCWVFVLWGFPWAFGVAYVLMFVINTAYTVVSMRRKYKRLAELARPDPREVAEK